MEVIGGVKKSSGGDGGKIIPDSVMDAVNRTSKNIEDVRAHFDEFLSVCDADVLAQLDPLERAQSLLLLAKVTTNLFALRLRCNGVNPDDHPVKSELERLSLYQEKVQRCIDLSKAPLRPSATINSQAATRFIEHSLPDLSRDQKQSLREIGRREGTASKSFERSMNKKRKYESPEKKSVQAAAQEFLQKAARELLGENKSGFKGPVHMEETNTDDEIDAMFGDDKGNDASEPIVIDDSD
ncbi:hypothetical protein M9H77_13494 [Catharanthus roseus]|uniref:Uncharacterized protein n=1 Tax=Catharanthus roseus TaxID=4058 RepID=A0ACC0BK97_CATRO|nr:hypothetical protein M9H77_13494 [Catharanthus roseus]